MELVLHPPPYRVAVAPHRREEVEPLRGDSHPARARRRRGALTPLGALTARIYAHNGKEERILYPATDKAARDADALEALVQRIRPALG